jgi:hypothetical protein
MTQTEWVAATAPAPMARYLAHHTREADSLLRRSRLAAIACCRDIPTAVMPADGPALLDAVESWLDAGGRRPAAVGRLEKGLTAEVERLLPGWRACLHAGKYSARPYRLHMAAVAVTVTALPYRSQIDRAMILNGTVSAADAHPRQADARRRTADRVRCVFGNPFRPVRVLPGWRPPTFSPGSGPSTTSGRTETCRSWRTPWKTPWKTPGATTPTSSPTAGAAGLTPAGAGQWTRSWETSDT